ncbi:MAG TPA: hypothetical protein VFO34_09570 [Candidatus Acidoferrales bacterium]|nr:hypothetical protein [Candidatus Acidoferrales bacterium]
MLSWQKAQQETPDSVRRDWRTRLSDDKDRAYQSGLQDFEPVHNMFGIALNEAIDLKNQGSLDMAREQVRFSIAFCQRFVGLLSILLLTLERHSRHFGTLPNVEPLDVENFRSHTAKHKARMNATLSLVLWGRHNRFIQKVRVLEELVSDQEETYCATAGRIAEGSSISPKQDWRTLDWVHYDLTTASSESKILLKSFLVAVPDREVRLFTQEIEAAPPFSQPVEPDRRAAAFRRQ